MYNYEEQTNKQNKETLDRELQLKADFKEVFSNVSGKRVYKHLVAPKIGFVLQNYG